MSNEMEVTLPLDTQYIRLPPKEVRTEDEDLYLEYIEVHEAGGKPSSACVHCICVTTLKFGLWLRFVSNMGFAVLSAVDLFL